MLCFKKHLVHLRAASLKIDVSVMTSATRFLLCLNCRFIYLIMGIINESYSLFNSGTNSSMIAIDNKIEQAMVRSLSSRCGARDTEVPGSDPRL